MTADDRPAPTPEVEAGERETCGLRGLPHEPHGIYSGDLGKGPDSLCAPSQSPQGSELGDGAVESYCADIYSGHHAWQDDKCIRCDTPAPEGVTGLMDLLNDLDPDMSLTTGQLAKGILASDWLAQREAAAVKAALLSAADEVERELICCDVFERRDVKTSHKICYWAGAAHKLITDHANRSEGGRA